MTTSLPKTAKRRRFTGLVTSTAMQKTAVVRVDRRVADKKYGKVYVVSKKYHVDNPEHLATAGDEIAFEESRPMSKQKRWRYVATIKRASGKELLPAEGLETPEAAPSQS